MARTGREHMWRSPNILPKCRSILRSVARLRKSSSRASNVRRLDDVSVVWLGLDERTECAMYRLGIKCWEH